MGKKRIVNVRPLFTFFVSLIFGILFVYSLINSIWSGKANLLIILSSIYFLCICALMILSFIFKGKIYSSKLINFFSRISACKLAIIGGVVCFVIGASCFMGFFSHYNKMEKFDGKVVEVTGRISSIKHGNKTSNYEIVDVCIQDENGIRKLKSGGVVYVYNDAEIAEGDCVKFSAEITSADIKNGYSSFVNNVAYRFYNVNDLVVDGNKLHLDEKVRLTSLSRLDENMNSQNAGIAYSVLFGDKSELNPNVRSSFSYAGIAHILAVSGLHVGFLVAILAVILKRVHVNKYVNCVITFIVLVIYCWLCGFTPSVVRASIMAITLLMARLLGEEYDGLSALSFAGIIILLFNPFDLFNVGFQLSFASVFGILTLAPSISMFLEKCKIPKIIRESFAISLSTNIAIIMIALNYFNEFALLGIFTNLIVLPVFSVTYGLLFVVNIFALIIPALGALFHLPDILLHFIKLVANFVSGLNFGVVSVFKVGFIIITLVLIICYISHFVMINKILKTLIVSAMAAVVIVSLIGINIPATFNRDAVYLTYQSSGNYALLTNDEDKRILVGIDEGGYLASYLNNLKVDRLDCIVVYQPKLKDVDYINELIEKYAVQTVVFATMKEEYETILYNDIKCKSIVFVDDDTSLNLYGYTVNICYYYGNPLGVVISKDKDDLLLLKDRATRKSLLHLSKWWGDKIERVVVNKNYVEDLQEILGTDEIYSYGYSKIKSADKVDIGYKSSFTLYL